MQVDLASHAIARTIIRKAGDIDFANTPDTELEYIALPHAVDVIFVVPVTVMLLGMIVSARSSSGVICSYYPSDEILPLVTPFFQRYYPSLQSFLHFKSLLHRIRLLWF